MSELLLFPELQSENPETNEPEFIPSDIAERIACMMDHQQELADQSAAVGMEIDKLLEKYGVNNQEFIDRHGEFQDYLDNASGTEYTVQLIPTHEGEQV